MPVVNAAMKAVSRPLDPRKPFASPDIVTPSRVREMASLESSRKPMTEAIMTEMKLIWLPLGRSRFWASQKCLAVVAAAQRATMPIE